MCVCVCVFCILVYFNHSTRLFNSILIWYSASVLDQNKFLYIYIYIYNWKKNATDCHLAIINKFQLPTPKEKPTSSNSHHMMERKN